MKVKELVELLQNQNEDAEVIVYNALRGDDLNFKFISVSEDSSEVYINVVG